jgi:hypothetical protein
MINKVDEVFAFQQRKQTNRFYHNSSSERKKREINTREEGGHSSRMSAQLEEIWKKNRTGTCRITDQCPHRRNHVYKCLKSEQAQFYFGPHVFNILKL